MKSGDVGILVVFIVVFLCLLYLVVFAPWSLPKKPVLCQPNCTGYFSDCSDGSFFINGSEIRRYNNKSCIVYDTREEYLADSDYIYKRDYINRTGMRCDGNGTCVEFPTPDRHCYIYLTQVDSSGKVRYEIDGMCYPGHMDEALAEMRNKTMLGFKEVTGDG